MGKTALITGITGQDGSYLCELLLQKGYTVHGWTRNLKGQHVCRLQRFVSSANASEKRLHLHQLDGSHINEITEFINQIELDEVYNLAGQSHVGESFQKPVETFNANVTAVLHLLEAIRKSPRCQSIRFFQAGSAAVFEGSSESPQSETTHPVPRSPYAASKLSSQILVQSYRDSYGMFACCGTLFNHESLRRPVSFVTGKIVDAVAHIALGEQSELRIGNLETGRDWGFAGDYVRAMWMMLQSELPRDFVIATGEWHSLRQFLTIAFRTVGLDWEDYTVCDPELYRNHDSARLVGDASLIAEVLGWKPSVDFTQMVEEMVQGRLSEIRYSGQRLIEDD